jgi:riboflavin transporter FmnP
MNRMQTKTIALTAVFAALTIILNPTFTRIGVPAPYAPFLIYQIWEIPIVAAFLLCGVKSGVSISLLNTIVLVVLFPGALPTGPLYNLAAVLSMLLGTYIAHKLLVRNPSKQKPRTEIALATTLGITSRVALMTVVNYVFLRFPPPLGYAMPEEAILLMLPLIGFFNATLALYTIPIGYLIAKTIKSSIKL